MSLIEVCFTCWGIYESILLIVSISIFFVLCFLQFHGNARIKYCFDFLNKKNTYFFLCYLFIKKKKKKRKKKERKRNKKTFTTLLKVNRFE